MDRLPGDVQNLIWEYTQDPDSLVLSHGRRMVINRSSSLYHWGK